jgi:hypothetical protein
MIVLTPATRSRSSLNDWPYRVHHRGAATVEQFNGVPQSGRRRPALSMGDEQLAVVRSTDVVMRRHHPDGPTFSTRTRLHPGYSNSDLGPRPAGRAPSARARVRIVLCQVKKFWAPVRAD